MTEVTALFVYGTLKPGEANWPLLAPYARSTSRAWMRGCLHDAGCFPALGEGDDMVYGELVRVATRDLPVVLLLLDHLEGCILYDPGRSFFTRRLTDVVTDDGTVQAWVYFYEGSNLGWPPVGSLRRLVGGEWMGMGSDSGREEGQGDGRQRRG